MRPISDYFPRVLPYVPGCSEPLAAQALLDSAIAFCEATDVIRERIDPFMTEAGRGAYELDTPPQQRICRVTQAWVDASPLTLVASVDFGLVPGISARPQYAYGTRADSEFVLNLHRIPDAVYEVNVEVALAPVRNATMVQDDLVDLWEEPVVAGALARMKEVPGQPFSDATGAIFYAQRSHVLTQKARFQGQNVRMKASRAVAPVKFA